MKAVNLRVQGAILTANGRYAVLLQNANPEQGAVPLVYLRFAFITMGVEEHIFPSFLLDDWGSEIKSLELYAWIDEFAPQFPRAELFGFDESGQEAQLFLRALEQYSKWPCYAYLTADTAVQDGQLLDAILLPDDSVTTPTKMKQPSWAKLPLRRARVKWWQVPTGFQSASEILT